MPAAVSVLLLRKRLTSSSFLLVSHPMLSSHDVSGRRRDEIYDEQLHDISVSIILFPSPEDIVVCPSLSLSSLPVFQVISLVIYSCHLLMLLLLLLVLIINVFEAELHWFIWDVDQSGKDSDVFVMILDFEVA